MLKWLLVAVVLGLVLLLWRISAMAKAKLPRVNHVVEAERGRVHISAFVR